MQNKMADGYLSGLLWSAYCWFPYSECENPVPPVRRCMQLWTESLLANIFSIKDYLAFTLFLSVETVMDVIRGFYCQFPYVECKYDDPVVDEDETSSWPTRLYSILSSRYFSPSRTVHRYPELFDVSSTNRGRSLTIKGTEKDSFHSIYCQLPFVECKFHPVVEEETPIPHDIFTIIWTLADDFMKLVTSTSKSSFVFNVFLAFILSIVVMKLTKVSIHAVGLSVGMITVILRALCSNAKLSGFEYLVRKTMDAEHRKTFNYIVTLVTPVTPLKFDAICIRTVKRKVFDGEYWKNFNPFHYTDCPEPT